MSNRWEELVKHCANGRQVCNCGRAYYSAIPSTDPWTKEVTYRQGCQYGCQAAVMAAEDHVAKVMLAAIRKGEST